MSENNRQPVVIPPKYVNVPSKLVYDKSLPEQVRNTYIQLYGLSWQSYGHLEITWDDLIELTGKSRTILYGHLAVLRSNSWLRFSYSRKRMLIVQFTDKPEGEKSSRFPDSLNDDVFTKNQSINNSIKHHHVNDSLTPEIVRNSGRKLKLSEFPDKMGRQNSPLTPHLADLLTRVGVYAEKFDQVASSGWTVDQLEKLAREVLDELGAGNGGGVFLYRLKNRRKPLSEKEERRRYISGEYGQYVEH